MQFENKINVYSVALYSGCILVSCFYFIIVCIISVSSLF